MKTSFCSIALKEEPLAEIAARVAAIGYDGIEIWGPHLEQFLANQEIAVLSGLLERHHLQAACLSPYFDFVSSAEKAQESIAAAQRYAAYAEALHCERIRVFTGPAGSAQATEEQWDRAVESLRAVCDASPCTFVLEVHPNNLMDTTEATIELLRRVHRENLRVNLDIYNLFEIGEPVLWALNELYPYTAHTHLKNRREGKPALLEEGGMEYEPFLTALQERWYDGYLSVEWFGPDPYWAAEQDLAYLRTFLD